MDEKTVSGYSFSPDDLDIGARRPGISAFMRIRNGADFLEAAIRSHIDFFDELVAVHNQCTDATPDILARLAQEYGPKLAVIHYLDQVHPPGSAGHAAEPAHSPHSVVNYSNYALAATQCRMVAKVDDDHVAMARAFAALERSVRKGEFGHEMSCFSGVNLARDEHGGVGVLAADPLAGAGDHGIFPVTPETYFVHDSRFERLKRGRLRRRFRCFAYWHMKYLKQGFGFANYDLADNPGSRFARKLAALQRERRLVRPDEIRTLAEPSDRLLVAARRLRLPLPEKLEIKADRWLATGALQIDAAEAFGDSAAPDSVGPPGGVVS